VASGKNRARPATLLFAVRAVAVASCANGDPSPSFLKAAVSIDALGPPLFPVRKSMESL
jgi:hypothetical protein